MFDWLKKSFKENHLAQMALCCLLPIILIVALRALGFDGPLVYAAALVLCVGSHLALMAIGGKAEKACH